VQQSEAVHEIVAKQVFLLQRSKREKTSHDELCHLCRYPTYSKRDLDRQTIDREDRQTMERERENIERQQTQKETERNTERKKEQAV
jgi:hypothetical protein